MTKINGKVAWITGASSGIGEATAKAMAKNGAKLILSARRKEELIRVKKEIGLEEVAILPLDLSDSNSFQSKSEEAIGFFGGVDILFNNGGISQRGFARETSLEVYRRIMEVNFFGNIGITLALLDHLRERKGHIVVTSSLVGKFGTPVRTGYAASKHSLHGFYDSLRAEEWPDLRVTLVCPGYVQTSITKNSLTGTGDVYNKVDSIIANGLPPEKVAARILKALDRNEEEIVIAGKEGYAVLIKRFFPRLFSSQVRKIKVH
jgi:short-subunit dehydrogenase